MSRLEARNFLSDTILYFGRAFPFRWLPARVSLPRSLNKRKSEKENIKKRPVEKSLNSKEKKTRAACRTRACCSLLFSLCRAAPIDSCAQKSSNSFLPPSLTADFETGLHDRLSIERNLVVAASLYLCYHHMRYHVQSLSLCRSVTSIVRANAMRVFTFVIFFFIRARQSVNFHVTMKNEDKNTLSQDKRVTALDGADKRARKASHLLLFDFLMRVRLNDSLDLMLRFGWTLHRIDTRWRLVTPITMIYMCTSPVSSTILFFLSLFLTLSSVTHISCLSLILFFISGDTLLVVGSRKL